MEQKNALIKGTLILTLAGLCSRVLGFVMRIFLSRYLGAEGIGLVQLASPLYLLGLVISSYGIQTAISRFVSATPKERGRERSHILKVGLGLALFLSFLYAFFLYRYADNLSMFLLKEASCGELLRVMALCTPLGAFHLCMNGYYYGLKKTGIPAFSQLIEQSIRILSVLLLFSITSQKGIAFSPFHAVLGNLAGDAASVLFNLTALAFQKRLPRERNAAPLSCLHTARRISMIALPLTVSQTISHIFQSTETVLIPSMLRSFGYDSSQALSMYGILTGMALPLILFPSTLTNSFAVMLLPTISEAYSRKNQYAIGRITRLTIHLCLILGIFSTGYFLFMGSRIGLILYNNATAGAYITTLGFLCPFLFLNITLSSILNGLGRTSLVFRNNLIGLTIRIVFTMLVIPKIGIYGYLIGFLLSSLITTLLLCHSLKSMVRPLFRPFDYLCKPFFAIGLSMLCFQIMKHLFHSSQTLTGLLLESALFLCLYLIFLKVFLPDFSFRLLTNPLKSRIVKK